MTAENHQKVINWILTKVPNWQCIFCTAKKWSVGEAVLMPLASAPAMEGYVAVTVHCAECGRIDMFDASQIPIDAPY